MTKRFNYPILRTAAAAADAEGRLSQNHASVDNDFFPSSPLEGDDGSLLVLVFCLRGSQHLPSLWGEEEEQQKY